MSLFALKSNSSGFTLIELLVVISIIGTLASTVLVAVQDARDAAWDTQVMSEVKNIQTALELYRSANSDNYPVGAAVSITTLNSGSNNITPYINPIPVPPHPKFKTAGRNYAYWSSADRKSYVLLVRFSRHDNGGSVRPASNCFVKRGGASFAWTAPPPYDNTTNTDACDEIPSSL